MGVAASIAARSPCEISTRAARRRMMYNSQIQRLHSFHRPPAQRWKHAPVFRRAVQANAPAYLRPLKGPRMMSCPHMAQNGRDRRLGGCPLLREGRTRAGRSPISARDPERPCSLRAACRVLPPALLHRLIVLAGARTCIARLGVPIALEKEAEAVVAPVVAARHGDIDARPARHEAALGLVVQHRDELGAIVGLAA